MNRLTIDQVNSRTVSDLGLDGSLVDLTVDVAIAAAIRRVAGIMCPCSGATIVNTVAESLHGVTTEDDIRERVTELLEAEIAHGDLQEHRQLNSEEATKQVTLTYAAPPTFVARASGSAILLGCAPDGQPMLPDELERRLEYSGYVRRIAPMQGESLTSRLIQVGLVELPYERWLSMPAARSASAHVAALGDALEKSASMGTCDGWSLLDPSKAVNFYKGRWIDCGARDGRFVARRSQAYGADLWCYANIKSGNLQFVDLPLTARVRGCDDAWHLQMAIDFLRGTPQVYRLAVGPTNTRIVELFSPVPLWVRRRWNALGEEVQRRGCLFAYKFPEPEWPEEERFLKDALWLAPIT